MSFKLIGSYYLWETASFYLKWGAEPWVEVPLPGGLFWTLADGSGDDLCKAFVDLVMDVITTNTWSGTYALTLNSTTGILTSHWSGTSKELAFKWEHPTTPASSPNSYFLGEWLRQGMPQVDIPANTTLAGNRTHGFGIYPIRYALEDLSSWEARVHQAVPDAGPVQTLRIAQLEKYNLGIRLDQAYPRPPEPGFNEYNAFVDFMAHASSGRPIRIFPDKTVLTPWVEGTNPWGWRDWVMDKESMSWKPNPAFGNWYRVMDQESLKFHRWEQ